MVDTPHTLGALARPLSRDARVIAVISAAHFVSHYYILLLAPLFAFVRADYGVSYTELGIALTAFNLVSGMLQTPVGFLVDRIGARSMLVVGMVTGAAAFAVAGLVHSFWVMIAMFAVAGLGNTVYHPADYAILSQQVSSDRTARAFSIHSFAGMVGSACAPASVLFLEGIFGWRGAFVLAAVVGVVVAGVVAIQGDVQITARAPTKSDGVTPWQLLLSPVILLNFAYFTLLSFVSAGIQNYTVVGLEALFGTPFAVGSSALSAYLTLLAAGVLTGGFFVGRLKHRVAPLIAGLAVAAVCMVAVSLLGLGAGALIVVLGFAGFMLGLGSPARDMVAREVTPAGAYGTVFGFLSTGMNLAWAVAPIVFGQLLDRGYPRAVFLIVAASCVIAIPTILIGSRKPQ
jgi:FSR family fosmidomycin resistance protein-like MFS transporter